ncbi:hypothetical protein D918_01807 [Trichuris suis]|nr:hypothetical protein D918_01807 [Trichuris suis]
MCSIGAPLRVNFLRHCDQSAIVKYEWAELFLYSMTSACSDNNGGRIVAPHRRMDVKLHKQRRHKASLIDDLSVYWLIRA